MAKKKVNKMDAVRQALAALGNDAPVADLQGFLKERFGLEMSSKFVSTYRANIIKKAGQTKQPAAKKQPALAPTTANGPGVLLDDVLALKGLVGRVGADHLRTLIDVMAK